MFFAKTPVNVFPNPRPHSSFPPASLPASKRPESTDRQPRIISHLDARRPIIFVFTSSNRCTKQTPHNNWIDDPVRTSWYQGRNYWPAAHCIVFKRDRNHIVRHRKVSSPTCVYARVVRRRKVISPPSRIPVSVCRNKIYWFRVLASFSKHVENIDPLRTFKPSLSKRLRKYFDSHWYCLSLSLSVSLFRSDTYTCVLYHRLDFVLSRPLLVGIPWPILFTTTVASGSFRKYGFETLLPTWM